MIRAILLAILASLCLAGEWAELSVTATAYCPCKICCGVRGVGITADGTDVREYPYGVASVPAFLPYGTKVIIPHGIGYLDKTYPEDDRVFTVDDTGGALRRNTFKTGHIHIDLRFIQHANALRFGVKRITIFVWED